MWVVDDKGERHRFLRGVVTHHLTQRGFDFDDAYAMARALRDRMAGREEVTASEIRDALEEQIETTFGSDGIHRLNKTPRVAAQLMVRSGSHRQPFSRGLLARSIQAAGLTDDRAYRLVTDLEGELRRDGIKELSSDEVARRIGDLVERAEGEAVARRYRSVRRLRRLPKPLVVYVGGASGTGKSTLALELAPLLKIYRVTATDTIRQVMRSLISPQILPAIHGSSFDTPTQTSQWLDGGENPADPHQVVISAYLEQTTCIGVGVRAVVERAIAENTSALLEGVHLVPPVVPFRDLEGACYQVPLLLGISDIEDHRARFLTRVGRRAERYVQRFGAIRALHDFILGQAEAEGIPFLDTSLEDAAPRALRVVVTMMQEQMPSFGAKNAVKRPPALLFAFDGVADLPTRVLGNRTPLAAAKTPTLDRLAREGTCGLADPVAPGVVPDTAAGTLALFGQSPSAMQRGPVEALGADLEIGPSDIALRANFATLEKNLVIDRRAGRIREEAIELAEALDRLPLPGDLAEEIEIRVAAATEHRLAVILRGDGLSSAVRGSDPGEGALPALPLTPRPHDPSDEEAVRTARALALFEQAARKVLARHPINKMRRALGQPPANAILTRGAGRLHRLASLEVDGIPLRLVCIAGDRTVRGIATWLDAEILQEPSMTANLDTDLRCKFDLALEALGRSDLVILHVKGADIAAHDRQPERKAAFIEAVDQELGRLLEKFPGPLRIAIASDHATSSESGHHTADPVPVLLWGPGVEADSVQSFDETAAALGELHRFPLQLLLGRLFDLG